MELSALRWTDIKDDNTMYVQSQYLTDYKMNDDLTFQGKEHINADHIKGRRKDGFRYQPLTTKALSILEKAKKVNPDGEFIFMFEGRQLTNDTFNRRLKKYCGKLGIESFSSHKIRFTVASILHDGGTSLPALQRLLGHSDLATTLRYLRLVKPTEETREKMCEILG